jgi:polar amino acid transport system ATP-binding protein
VSGLADTQAPFLRLLGVVKRFGDTEVLRGVDLDVGEHEVVSLIGAPGSGKSTLLRCVNALEPIEGGTIALQGQLVSGPKVDLDRHRRAVGIVFQSFNLFPHMTVLRNITLAPRQVLRISRKEAEERADYPDSLSGGQQQRVAIVRRWRCSRACCCCWTKSPARSTRSWSPRC